MPEIARDFQAVTWSSYARDRLQRNFLEVFLPYQHSKNKANLHFREAALFQGMALPCDQLSSGNRSFAIVKSTRGRHPQSLSEEHRSQTETTPVSGHNFTDQTRAWKVQRFHDAYDNFGGSMVLSRLPLCRAFVVMNSDREWILSWTFL